MEVAGARGRDDSSPAAERVPFVDLKVQARVLHDAYDGAIWSVIDRAAYTMGPELQAFESSFAELCGCAHAVGVSSGTDAVKLALLGAGVKPGDEVIVPVNTFIATAEAVSHIGARPVFVDCLERSGLIDPAAIGPAVTPRTTAVIPVHLYGQPCDMDAILAVAGRHGLAVVEDACQAHGASYKGRPAGSMGVTAAFSFYPGKNLGALGDGGAVTTSDDAIAATLRLYRNHGQQDKFTHSVVGYCDRLHNLQAALLQIKLQHLPAWNEARRAAAADYDAALRGVAGVDVTEVAADVYAVYHLYVVMLKERDDVKTATRLRGHRVGYPLPGAAAPAAGVRGTRVRGRRLPGRRGPGEEDPLAPDVSRADTGTADPCCGGADA